MLAGQVEQSAHLGETRTGILPVLVGEATQGQSGSDAEIDGITFLCADRDGRKHKQEDQGQ
jgi:hypothetical protein